MPISNPSYFPPSRANGSIVGITAGESFTGARSFLGGANAGNFCSANDLIVLGDNAVSLTGGLTPNASGTTVVGSGSLKILQDPGAGTEGVWTVLGFNNLPNWQFGDATVAIGDNIAVNVVGTNGIRNDDNVFIGSAVAKNATTTAGGRVTQNVLIGPLVVGTGGGDITSSVVIGAHACQQAARTLNSCTVVGAFSGQTVMATVNQADGVIILGAFCDGAAGGVNDGLNLIAIGNSISVHGAHNTLIGHDAGGTGANQHHSIALGNNANLQFGNHNIILGPFSGEAVTPGTSNLLLIETGENGLPARTLIRGDFGGQSPAVDGGNLILGDSTETVNDDMVGTNTVKLLNGTNGGATAPVGGGYFYLNAGELHWVGSDNTDTKLSSGTSPASFPDGWVVGAVAAVTATGDATLATLTTGILAGSGGLIATSAALTDHSAAAAGTLLNSPAAGNPSKWIAINDNGVLRGIPTWLI